MHRCLIGASVSHFLRLPDGNLNGEGFAATGSRSLFQLATGHQAPLPQVEGKGTFATWEALAALVRVILHTEVTAVGSGSSQIHMHATDPDTALNPGAHADHRATGRLAAEIASANGWTLSQYAGHSTAAWPTNVSAERFAECSTAAFHRSLTLSAVQPLHEAAKVRPDGLSQDWQTRADPCSLFWNARHPRRQFEGEPK